VKKKIIYVVSDSAHRTRNIAYEWYAQYMIEAGYSVSIVILKGNQSLQEYCKKNNMPFLYLNYQGKSKWEIASKIIKLSFYILKTRPAIIHTHYFDANLLGLISAKICRIKKRVFTRHNGFWGQENNPSALRFEKLFNKLATDIIVPSKIVHDIIIETDPKSSKKIHVIHHGFDLKIFKKYDIASINKMKEKYHIPSDKKIIGIVSSYSKLKGIEYLIDAFKQLLNFRNDIHLVLANAKGEDYNYVKEKLNTIPAENYTEIIFEENIILLFQTFDIFVHVPINIKYEAFGQVYIEALMGKIPSIFTLAGIAPEFITHKKNAYVVDYENSKEIYEGIIYFLNEKEKSKEIANNAESDIKNMFSIETMIKKYINTYN